MEAAAGPRGKYGYTKWAGSTSSSNSSMYAGRVVRRVSESRDGGGGRQGPESRVQGRSGASPGPPPGGQGAKSFGKGIH